MYTNITYKYTNISYYAIAYNSLVTPVQQLLAKSSEQGWQEQMHICPQDGQQHLNHVIWSEVWRWTNCTFRKGHFYSSINQDLSIPAKIRAGYIPFYSTDGQKFETLCKFLEAGFQTAKFPIHLKRIVWGRKEKNNHDIRSSVTQGKTSYSLTFLWAVILPSALDRAMPFGSKLLCKC